MLAVKSLFGIWLLLVETTSTQYKVVLNLILQLVGRFVKLLHITPEAGLQPGYRKVAWHPSLPNIFATAGSDCAIVWNLDEIKTPTMVRPISAQDQPGLKFFASAEVCWFIARVFGIF